MMDILMSEACRAHKKWNKIASDIKLAFHPSTITMMHGPINISCRCYLDLYFLSHSNFFCHRHKLFSRKFVKSELNTMPTREYVEYTPATVPFSSNLNCVTLEAKLSRNSLRAFYYVWTARRMGLNILPTLHSSTFCRLCKERINMIFYSQGRISENMRLILLRTLYRLDYPDLAELDPWPYKTVSLPFTLYVGSTQPLIEGALSSALRRPECEAVRSPTPSVEHMDV